MGKFPATISNLIEEFAKFPGIGRKTAERFVFFLLKQQKNDLLALTNALTVLQTSIHTCLVCGNFAETEERCPICRNPSRDQSIVCVVEQIHDLNVIEETNEYHGVYHVLGGTLNPIEGITENHLHIRKLIDRVKTGTIKEMILALNPDMPGEATMIYLKKLFQPANIKITRLARGLPMGSDIEYADEVTLANALKGRRDA